MSTHFQLSLPIRNEVLVLEVACSSDAALGVPVCMVPEGCGRYLPLLQLNDWASGPCVGYDFRSLLPNVDSQLLRRGRSIFLPSPADKMNLVSTVIANLLYGNGSKHPRSPKIALLGQVFFPKFIYQ